MIELIQGDAPMTAQQRHAAFNVIVALATLILFLSLIPHFGLEKAQAAYALLSLYALGSIVYFRDKRKGAILWDERDTLIHSKSIKITFGILWILFAGGIMAVWAFHRNAANISVDILPQIVMGGFLALSLCQSLTVLFLYWRS
jgi:uncharacterized membrane protein